MRQLGLCVKRHNWYVFFSNAHCVPFQVPLVMSKLHTLHVNVGRLRKSFYLRLQRCKIAQLFKTTQAGKYLSQLGTLSCFWGRPHPITEILSPMFHRQSGKHFTSLKTNWKHSLIFQHYVIVLTPLGVSERVGHSYVC